MRITDYRIETIEIPLRTPFVTALRHVETVTTLRLTLYTDTGLIGIGEAPPTEAITGESLTSIRDTLQSSILPAYLGTPLQNEGALAGLSSLVTKNTSAKAAFDIACYDLLSRHAGQPLYAYLGGTPSALLTDITISLASPLLMAEEARHACTQGFSQLKVKLGGRDGKDADRVRAVADAAPEATLMLDANQAWNAVETLELLHQIPLERVALLEQPVAAADLKGMKRVTQSRMVPVLADEAVFSYDDARRLIENDVADMINVKLMKCGGIFEGKRILELCRVHGRYCMLGSMLEGPYSIAAAANLALAYRDVIRYCDLDSPQLYAKTPDDSPIHSVGARLVLQ